MWMVCCSLVSRPLPDFISQPWRKIRPGITATSQAENGGLGLYMIWTQFVHKSDHRPSPGFFQGCEIKIWKWPGDEARRAMLSLLLHLGWLPAWSLQCLSSHFGCGVDLFTSTDVHHLHLLRNTVYDKKFANRKFSPISSVDVNGENISQNICSHCEFWHVEFFVQRQLLTHVPELAC